MFILSRNSYFDHWTWPGVLLGIFGCTIVLACVAWFILRRAAHQLRKEAENRLEKALDETKRGMDKAKRRPVQTGGDQSSEVLVTPREHHRHLLKLLKLIKDERRGAYAEFFQDPALIAAIFPAGLLGILVVLFRALFGTM